MTIFHFVLTLTFCQFESNQIIINNSRTGVTVITSKPFRIHNYCQLLVTTKPDNDVIETNGTKIEAILARQVWPNFSSSKISSSIKSIFLLCLYT